METETGANFRGSQFEKRVFNALEKLEKTGFARSIIRQEKVADRNGNIRKIDLSFILCTFLIELKISIECKSRDRSLTLDDINQIKIFKAELPERNLFWLVIDGTAGSNVLDALKSAGISFYKIEILESIISNIYLAYQFSDLRALRAQTLKLNSMDVVRVKGSIFRLRLKEQKFLKRFADVAGILTNNNSPYLQRFEDGDNKNYEKKFYKGIPWSPYLIAAFTLPVLIWVIRKLFF